MICFTFWIPGGEFDEDLNLPMWLADKFVAHVKYANQYTDIFILKLIYIRHTKKHVYICLHNMCII